jgi:hypothetical protein
MAGSVTAGKKATASNVFQNAVARHGPQMAVDDNDETRNRSRNSARIVH